MPPPDNISIKAVSLAEYDLRPGLLEFEIVAHLVCAHAVGQIVGLTAGPGDSPHALE